MLKINPLIFYNFTKGMSHFIGDHLVKKDVIQQIEGTVKFLL